MSSLSAVVSLLNLTDPLRESLLILSFLYYSLLIPYEKVFLCPFLATLYWLLTGSSSYVLSTPCWCLTEKFCFFTTFFTAPYWSFAGESSAVRSLPLTGSLLCTSFSLLHFINHCTLLAPCRKVFFFCPLFTTLYWPLTDLYYSVLTPHEKIFLFPCCTTLYWSLAGKSSSSSILSLQHLIWSLAGKVSSSSVLSLWESFFLCPFFKGKSYPLSFLYGKASSSVLSLRESLLLTFFTTPYWSLAGKSSSI